MIKLKSGTITPLVSELQRAEMRESVSSGPSISSSSKLMETFSKYLEHACYLQVALIFPGSLKVNKHGPGRSLSIAREPLGCLKWSLSDSVRVEVTRIYAHIKIHQAIHLSLEHFTQLTICKKKMTITQSLLISQFSGGFR